MTDNYGAPSGAWETWRKLAEDDLLPSIANPDAKISAQSTLQGIGKTPSRYNMAREAIGIGKWTQYMPSSQELDRWAAEPDYGICVQTRGKIKAIDVDVEDPKRAGEIMAAIFEVLGKCPVRHRINSGKFLIPIFHDDPMPKAVLQVNGGIVEILGDGQQFIAEGRHSSGAHYEWTKPPAEAPTVSGEQLEALRAMLGMCFGTADWKIAREKREGSGGYTAGTDDVAEWLVANWETYDAGASGQIDILCPFAGEHSGDSAQSSTSYFPAGTGGYSQGNFVCLHAHCVGRDNRDYLSATGYSAAEFADLRRAVVPSSGGSPEVGDDGGAVPTDSWGVTRDKAGGVFPTADNIVKLCSHANAIHKTLAFDTFKDELVWAPGEQLPGKEQWRAFGDVDYIDVRIRLERLGMKPMSKDLLREGIKRAAYERYMDTAQEWLSRLAWDGVERIDSFCIAGWGWAATDYSRAVGRYLWTGLAGRVIEPGVQCDMAPILVGAQGVGKTSAIKAMSPSDECYVSVPLDDHDNDTARRLRGKLVGELEELRGLNSRGIEAIKAWITRTSEGWVPKYMEFEATFKRRNLFIGTTNEDEFLADPTGERRFLPGRCGTIDVPWIKANRDQLWAEGAVKFMLGGVDWEGAQTLGAAEHHDFKVTDSWEGTVARWLVEPQIHGGTPTDVGHVTVSEVLAGAVGIVVGQQDRGKEMRMAKVLRGLGWERRRLPVQPDGTRPWAYVKDVV